MARSYQLTIDCQRPGAQVEFWCRALGYRPVPAPEGFATWNDWYRSVGVPESELLPDEDGSDRIEDPDGVLPPIWFQLVPETKELKNRLHLDLDVGIVGGVKLPWRARILVVDEFVAEMVEAGARELLRTTEPEHDRYFVVLADPEGNEFCVR